MIPGDTHSGDQLDLHDVAPSSSMLPSIVGGAGRDKVTSSCPAVGWCLRRRWVRQWARPGLQRWRNTGQDGFDSWLVVALTLPQFKKQLREIGWRWLGKFGRSGSGRRKLWRLEAMHPRGLLCHLSPPRSCPKSWLPLTASSLM
ncbi:MAG: hypothetical protein H6667_17760 [Ardenticatenaceae bacterium]|nr:hypothetical protein [Ardenticatenaceae bacterium]